MRTIEVMPQGSREKMLAVDCDGHGGWVVLNKHGGTDRRCSTRILVELYTGVDLNLADLLPKQEPPEENKPDVPGRPHSAVKSTSGIEYRVAEVVSVTGDLVRCRWAFGEDCWTLGRNDHGMGEPVVGGFCLWPVGEGDRFYATAEYLHRAGYEWLVKGTCHELYEYNLSEPERPVPEGPEAPPQTKQINIANLFSQMVGQGLAEKAGQNDHRNAYMAGYMSGLGRAKDINERLERIEELLARIVRTEKVVSKLDRGKAFVPQEASVVAPAAQA